MTHTQTFSVGDRVIVTNESLATNLEKGTVTAIKDTGLVVIKFDSFDPNDTRGGRSHNAYRPNNLRHLPKVRQPAQTQSTKACKDDVETVDVKGVGFVASLYNGDEFIYMMTSDDEKELTDAIVRKFVSECTEDPGVKIIKAPHDHRWNSTNGGEHSTDIVKVQPHIKEVCVLRRTPKYVYVYVECNGLDYYEKFLNEGCNDLGWAVKAAYNKPANVVVGTRYYVLDSTGEPRSTFIVDSTDNFPCSHDPENGVFNITPNLYIRKLH